MTRTTSTTPFFAALVAFVAAGAAARAAEPGGREIAQRVEEQNRSNTEISTFEMRIVDGKGKEKVRRIKSFSSTPKGGQDRVMLRFLDPPDVAGTGLLTLEGSPEDEQWIYLPAQKRTRRIAAGGKNESFMGSDLSYDDLRPRDVDAWEYKVLRSEKLPDGDTWVLEAVPVKGGKAADSEYGRTLSWIRKEDFVPLKGELYDKDGQLWKAIAYAGYKDDGGVKRPASLSVENRKKGSKTVMSYVERAINTPIDDGVFTARSLEAP
ncbi:MAG: outer membrane lipoprotein-sorting protein [Acidobacteriota bacterium]